MVLREGMASIDALCARAKAAFDVGNFECATTLLTQLLALMEQSGQSDHALMTHVLLMLAVSHSNTQQFHLSMLYAERTITRLDERHELDALGPEKRACCEQIRAVGLAGMDRTTEAIAAYELALGLFARTQLPDSAQLDSLIGIATACIRTGDVERGLTCVREAEILALTLSDRARRLDYLSSIANARGNLLLQINRTAESIVAFRARLDYDTQLSGNHTVESAEAMVALASALALNGDLDGATSFLDEASERFTKLGLTASAAYAVVWEKRSVVLCQQERFDECLEALEQSLLLRRQLGISGHEIAASLRNIETVLRILGREEEADARGEEARLISRRLQVACAGPVCQRKLREDGAPLDVCVKCRRTFYCGKACQTADWKREGGHRAECKALIAEGEAVCKAPKVLD